MLFDSSSEVQPVILLYSLSSTVNYRSQNPISDIALVNRLFGMRESVVQRQITRLRVGHAFLEMFTAD